MEHLEGEMRLKGSTVGWISARTTAAHASSQIEGTPGHFQFSPVKEMWVQATRLFQELRLTCATLIARSVLRSTPLKSMYTLASLEVYY